MPNLYVTKADWPLEGVLKDVVSQDFLRKNNNGKIIEYKAKFNFKRPYYFYLYIKTLIYFIVYIRNTEKLINYQINGINIGNAAYTVTLRNFRVHDSKILLFSRLLLQFILSIREYIFAINLAQSGDSVYIKEIIYRERILFDVCMMNNIGAYIHNYPYALVFFKDSKFTVRKIMKYPYPKAQYTDNIYHHYMSNRMTDPEKYIPYYSPDKKAKVGSININKKKSTILIYAHSFTDAQLTWGFDGFTNVLDWLNFTIKNLTNRGFQVIVKGHPNFWVVGYLADVIEWDKKIWREVQDKYAKFDDVEFINFPVSNNEILKKLDKENTIVISHHTNGIVEAAYVGFKCISSGSSPWGDIYYSFCETWNSKNTYLDLLSNVESTKFPDESKLKNFVFDKYVDNYSYHGKFCWYSQLATELGVTSNQVVKDPKIVTLDKFNNYELTIKKISENIKVVE